MGEGEATSTGEGQRRRRQIRKAAVGTSFFSGEVPVQVMRSRYLPELLRVNACIYRRIRAMRRPKLSPKLETNITVKKLVIDD